MANVVFAKAKESILEGEIDVTSDQLKVLIIDSGYTPNINSDRFVSDVPVNSIKYRSQSLINVTNVLGVVDAEDLVISNYPGNAFNAIIIYKDTGSDQTSPLIAYINDSPRNTFFWIFRFCNYKYSLE